MAYARMAPCSLKSASMRTRPCCSTRLKCLFALNVSREKSPLIAVPSSGEDQPRIEPRWCELHQAFAEQRRTLRLVKIVIDTHLGSVVGARADLDRTRVREARVVGVAVACSDELRTHTDRLERRLRPRE